ncbi:helix-turn-helix domain-containing protein [Vibrio salilacus]|uniref:helix-turn-helix domain-containing protein n=1 Tax=Vibrio salilacus TaxID=1323749 RepID=UPI001FEC1232|nr:helix-turn-helix transcriptional regulator [Vibrio salilacus]
MPQSHISKIESGGVDLRISSLIALARVLLILESYSPFKGMLDQSYSPLNSPVG